MVGGPNRSALADGRCRPLAGTPHGRMRSSSGPKCSGPVAVAVASSGGSTTTSTASTSAAPSCTAVPSPCSNPIPARTMVATPTRISSDSPPRTCISVTSIPPRPCSSHATRQPAGIPCNNSHFRGKPDTSWRGSAGRWPAQASPTASPALHHPLGLVRLRRHPHLGEGRGERLVRAHHERGFHRAQVHALAGEAGQRKS